MSEVKEEIYSIGDIITFYRWSDRRTVHFHVETVEDNHYTGIWTHETEEDCESEEFEFRDVHDIQLGNNPTWTITNVRYKISAELPEDLFEI